MKAKVLKPFADADDLSRTYRAGDAFEGSEERVKALEGGGYVKRESARKPKE